jgi:hypothetical protein
MAAGWMSSTAAVTTVATTADTTKTTVKKLNLFIVIIIS